jgi:glycosyltransferase involved in cell wall biosynthesis
VRAELGLPPDALVMGHIGRLVAPKNHRFLLEIAAHVVAAAPHARLLLVGDGPLRTDLEQQAAAMGLGEHVVFAGTRPDVARLLPGAVDVFVLPSCYEGLGLAGIEAQAAGLPCLFSEQVPPEATVVAPLVRRLSLAQPPAAWARAVLSLHAAGPLLSRAEALACVQQSGFDVQQSIKRLHALYLAEVAHAGSA